MISQGSKVNKKISKRSIVGVVCLSLILLWITFPIMRGIADSGTAKIGFAFLMLFSIVLLKKRWLVNSMQFTFIAAFTVFIFIYLVDFLLRRGDMTIFDFVNYFVLFFCIAASVLIAEHENDKMERFLLGLFFLLCIISLITTIFGLITDASAIRLLTSSSTSEAVEEQLRSKNIGGYDFLYSLLILIPVLIQVVKCTKSWTFKIAGIVWISLILICIILANFTIAYLFIGMIVIFSLFPSKMSTVKKVMISIIAFGVLFLLLKGFIIMYLQFIGNHTESIMTQGRMKQMEAFLTGQISIFEMNDRFVLAMNSMSTFWESPFFGGGAYFRHYELVSGHSTWIDELARNGIIGYIPFIVMMVSGVRNVIICKSTIEKNTILIVFVFYIVLGLVNNVFGYMISLVVFIITPMLVRQGLASRPL